MNLVKNEKLENNSHELQFSIDAEAFKRRNCQSVQTRAGKYNQFRASARAKPLAIMIEKIVRCRCVPLTTHQ